MKSDAAKEMNFLGYTSLIDFASTTFGAIKTKLGVITITGASLVTLITGYIYDSPHAVYTLWCLYAFDFLTAMICAWHKGTISSKRTPRVLLNAFVITSLLSLSWWMSKSSWVFLPLPATVIAISYSTLFISIVENLAKLNALPPKLISIVKRRFDSSSLETKIFDVDSVQDNQESIKD